MPTHAKPWRLSDLEPYDEEQDTVRAVVETPKGSRNKYDYDPLFNGFTLAKTLPDGMTFPFDFGFIPSTLGDDGDPVDVMVLLDAPAIPGCVLDCQLIGVIEGRQKEKGKSWVENDRLIARAVHARTHEQVKSIDDLPPSLIKDIEAFFVNYNALQGKRFECRGCHGPRRALSLLRAGVKAYRKQRRQ